METASVIRNLAATIFKMDPTKVHLSGSIDPEYRSINSSLSGGMWDKEETTRLWGFSPQTGFKEIKEIQYSEWNVPDGVPQDNRGNTPCLHQVSDVNEFLFFLEKKRERLTVPSNGVDRDSTVWTLFKAPNFREYWSKIEQKDLERWSNWLN